MKLVKIVLLLLLIYVSSDITQANLYTPQQKQALLGAGLTGWGAYSWYTRNKLYKMGAAIDLKKNVRRSLAVSRAYSAGRMLSGLYLLGRSYTSNLQSTPYYAPIKK